MAPLSSEAVSSDTVIRRSTRASSKPESSVDKVENEKVTHQQPPQRKTSVVLSPSSSRLPQSSPSVSVIKKSPVKDFRLEKSAPAAGFKLVKNGIIHPPNQSSHATPTHPTVVKLDNQSVKNPVMAHNAAASSAQGALSVNFIPVDTSGKGFSVHGQPPKASDGRPTFIVQIGANGQDARSGSTGTAVLPFNKDQSTAPTQCIFRLTEPAVAKQIAGMQTNQTFTLSRMAAQRSDSKVVFLPPSQTSFSPGFTRGPSQVITLTGMSENKTNDVNSATSSQQVNRPLKHPSGYSVITSVNALKSAPKVVVSSKVGSRISFPTKEAVVIPVSPVPVNPVGVMPRQDVVPLLTTVPPDTVWSDLVAAYEASGLNARCSKDKEKKLLADFDNIRCIYEDQQVLWKALPKPQPIDIPGLSARKIGDLLSLGRFIEILQHANKSTRAKKRCVDFEFITSAVVMADGNAAKYLFLVNWLVWAFDERKISSTVLTILPEFGVNIQSIEVDHLLSCEILRQYLVLLVEHRKLCPPNVEMSSLLKKVKCDDLTSLTVDERVDFLTFAHTALLQYTDFFPACFGRIESEHALAIAIKKAAIDDIATTMTALRATENELRMFDAREKTTRLEDRERTRLCDQIKTSSNEIEGLRQGKKSVEEDIEKTSKTLAMACHSEPLGYDRDFNRYWTFPELSELIFVESGWHAQPLNNKAPPVKTPKILGNFIFLDRLSELYYLNDNGTHSKCNAKTLAPLPLKTNSWQSYTMEAIPSLIQNLNQMGLREGALKMKLMALLAARTHAALQAPKIPRPAPVVAESFSEILAELFLKICNDLVENQILVGDLDVDWQTLLKSSDLNIAKTQIVATYRLIIPQLLRSDFFVSIEEKTWLESVLECSNMSRLYFLCKVLDQSVMWDKGTTKGPCRTCSRSGRRAKMRRCSGCLSVYHDKSDCMVFNMSRCTSCCGTALSTTEFSSKPSGSGLSDTINLEPRFNSTVEKESSQSSATTGVKRKASVERSNSTHSSVYSYKLRNKDRSVSTSSK